MAQSLSHALQLNTYGSKVMAGGELLPSRRLQDVLLFWVCGTGDGEGYVYEDFLDSFRNIPSSLSEILIDCALSGKLMETRLETAEAISGSGKGDRLLKKAIDMHNRMLAVRRDYHTRPLANITRRRYQAARLYQTDDQTTSILHAIRSTVYVPVLRFGLFLETHQS
jgi:hypothetical protein